MRDMLAPIPLFASLNEAELDRLARGCRAAHFAKGEVLLREGDRADGLYAVKKGVVKVISMSPEGRETVLHLVRPGNTLGEAAVFQQGTYPSTAVAVTPVDAIFLDGKTLTAMIAEKPELALRMLSALSARLRMFAHKLTAQSRGGAEKRLASYLLHRSQLNGGDPVIRLGVSREVLAGLLGFTRETLSRKLSTLAAEGAIRLRGRDILIEDRELLQTIASG